MLAIVDDELGVHGDAESPDVAPVARRGERGELDPPVLPVDGGGEGREDVGPPVVHDVPSDLRDPRPVEDPLRPKFGHEFSLLVEGEELGDEPQRAHRDEVLPLGLNAPDRGEVVAEHRLHARLLPLLVQQRTVPSTVSALYVKPQTYVWDSFWGWGRVG